MLSVIDRMLLESSDLSNLVNSNLYVGKQVKDILYKYADGSINGKDRLISDFEVIKADDPKDFGAIALKLDNHVIIAYTPSGNAYYDTLDWIGNFMTLFKNHIYSYNAIRFATDIINENKNIEKIYLTGHSLGGYLSQYVAYYLYKKLKFKKIKVVTFNSLGFCAPNHINNQRQFPIIKDPLIIDFIKFFLTTKLLNYNLEMKLFNYITGLNTKFYINLESKAIELGGIIDVNNSKWNGFCSEFMFLAKNYYVDADPIHSILGSKNLGNNIVFNSELIPGLFNDGIKAHQLYHFYSK